jgi:hypothetical protein
MNPQVTARPILPGSRADVTLGEDGDRQSRRATGFSVKLVIR